MDNLNFRTENNNNNDTFTEVSIDIQNEEMFKKINNEILCEAVYTSRIEGSLETVASTIKLNNSNNPPKDKSEQMPYNMLKLYSKYSTGIPTLNLDILQDIFDIINYKTSKEIKLGDPCLRDDYVYVKDNRDNIIYTPPKSEEVPNLINDFIDYYNSISVEDNLYDVYSKVHWDFVKIHPFIDGNGRTARFLAHMAVLKTGNTIYKNISITTEIYRNLSYYYETLQEKNQESFREFIELVMKSVVKRYDLKFGVQLSDSQRDFLNNPKFNSISLNKYMKKYKLGIYVAIEELRELRELGFIEKRDKSYIKLNLLK